VLDFPPDRTFIFQIILFLVLWTFLRRFLFEPNLTVLHDREHRSEGALKEATQVRAEAEAMSEQYKTRLAETRAGAMQQVETVYREAEEQARSLIEIARTDSARTIAGMRETIDREIAEARRNLETRTPDFARDIAEKLLGRPLTT
jgi:F-type H+-transporting ATPase subunit b